MKVNWKLLLFNASAIAICIVLAYAIAPIFKSGVTVERKIYRDGTIEFVITNPTEDTLHGFYLTDWIRPAASTSDGYGRRADGVDVIAVETDTVDGIHVNRFVLEEPLDRLLFEGDWILGFRLDEIVVLPDGSYTFWYVVHLPREEKRVCWASWIWVLMGKDTTYHFGSEYDWVSWVGRYSRDEDRPMLD